MSVSVISAHPPPLDDPSLSDPLSCPPLCWGILGCGRVAHDFCQALKHLPSQEVVACAARSSSSAADFAQKHNIADSYGDYNELLSNERVQIVYVANVHVFRRSMGEKCLLANKHILMEKPFALNAADAEYLFGLARERDLFAMEGMWTRFFPAVEQARRTVFGTPEEKGILGEIATVLSEFSFNAADSEEYPSSFLYNHKLGGGSAYLVGPYPIFAATMFFGGAQPDQIKAVGQLDPNTGVDLQGTAILSFPPTSDLAPALDPSNKNEMTPKLPGAGVATLHFGMLGEGLEETVVIGTKGRLTIKSPGHCPTKMILEMKADGRGASEKVVEYNFSLPEDTEEILEQGGYVYPNSAGFAYEAAAVARCIAAGRTETPQCTQEDTVNALRIIDAVREQIGVKPTPGA